MRISTNQFYLKNTLQMQQLQSDANKTLTQLATGKRVQTAADDPVASVALQNLAQQQTQLQQYKSNITLANNRLSLQETRFTEYENLMMDAKDRLLQGNNGALSHEDRQSVAMSLQQGRDALLALANRQDESGNYVFGGFKTDQAPYVEDASGEVSYRGDSGQRFAQIAEGISVPVSESGQRAFNAIPNPLGDYQPDYLGSTMQAGFSVDQVSISGEPAPQKVELTFAEDVNGVLGFSVSLDNQPLTDGALPPAIPQNIVFPYQTGSTVDVAGVVDITLSGEPQDGDTITLNQGAELDIFAMSQKAIDMLSDEAGLSGAAAQAEYGMIMANVGEALNHASLLRAETGNSLNALDTYQSRHENLELVTESARSSLEDVDMAEAITEFERQSLALNAISKTFAKVSDLNLFNYI